LQRDSKRLINHTAATAAPGWARTLNPAGSAAANDQRLHLKQFPRVRHARKRTLHGRNDLPA
jgi:hypothetical protein